MHVPAMRAFHGYLPAASDITGEGVLDTVGVGALEPAPTVLWPSQKPPAAMASATVAVTATKATVREVGLFQSKIRQAKCCEVRVTRFFDAFFCTRVAVNDHAHANNLGAGFLERSDCREG